MEHVRETEVHASDPGRSNETLSQMQTRKFQQGRVEKQSQGQRQYQIHSEILSLSMAAFHCG